MISDYDVDIQYHPKKANKVVDMLNQNTYDTLVIMRKLPGELVKEIKDLKIVIVHRRIGNLEV